MAIQYAHAASHSDIYTALHEHLQMSKVWTSWLLLLWQWDEPKAVYGEVLYSFWWSFRQRETPYSNSLLLEMNRGSTSGCKRPRNRVKRGKKKQRKPHESSNYSLCYQNNAEPIKLGIHSRQRQVEARRGSLFSGSVDGVPNQTACLEGCRDPSHCVLVDQSEASQKNSPSYAQYGWNVPLLAETEKILQSAMRRSAACWGCYAAPQLASASNVFLAFWNHRGSIYYYAS